MKRLPTDLKILDNIYNRYYQSFAAYSNGDKGRSDKVYIPVDIKKIAEDLNVDPDIIFGRLYYHLEKNTGISMTMGQKFLSSLFVLAMTNTVLIFRF